MSMNNLFANLNQNFMNQMFRRVENVVWDLSTGAVGILTKDDCIATFDFPALEPVNEDASETPELTCAMDGQVTLNPMATLSMALPAYGQKIPANQVKLGDIVVNNRGEASGWVCEIKKNGSFGIQKTDGNTTNFNPPKVNVIGMGNQDGVMVVRTLMSTSGTDLGGFKDMLMPIMMMSGGNLDENKLDKLMPMLLMGGMNGSNNNMMQMMLMMQMMNGSKSPF